MSDVDLGELIDSGDEDFNREVYGDARERMVEQVVRLIGGEESVVVKPYSMQQTEYEFELQRKESSRGFAVNMLLVREAVSGKREAIGEETEEQTFFHVNTDLREITGDYQNPTRNSEEKVRNLQLAIAEVDEVLCETVVDNLGEGKPVTRKAKIENPKLQAIFDERGFVHEKGKVYKKVYNLRKSQAIG